PIEIDGVLVDHANAAGGNALADGPGLIGAMDPIKRVSITLPEIHRAGAKRVTRAAAHTDAALQLTHLSPELRLSLQHLLGRIPVRPFPLIMNRRYAGPGEACAPDANAVADRNFFLL